MTPYISLRILDTVDKWVLINVFASLYYNQKKKKKSIACTCIQVTDSLRARKCKN